MRLILPCLVLMLAVAGCRRGKPENAPGPQPAPPAASSVPAEQQATPAPAPAATDTKPAPPPVAPKPEVSRWGLPGGHLFDAYPALTLRDETRAKDLPLRMTVPHGTGPFPVVVFSHGLFGSRDGYQPLAEHWAAHGYIVIQPSHGDSLQVRPALRPGDRKPIDPGQPKPDPRDRLDARRAALPSDSRLIGDRLRESLPERLAEWDDRALDVKLLLDRLPALAEQAKLDPAIFDVTRIAHAGHSFGAHTSMLIAGTTVRTGMGKRESFADPRVACTIWLSPQGAGGILDAESWNTCTRPVLTITGSQDNSPLEPMDPKTRRDGFDRMPPTPAAAPGPDGKPGAARRDKVLVWIEGLHHGMGGITTRDATEFRMSSVGPLYPDHVSWVKQATTAFLGAHLRSDAAARSFLSPGDASPMRAATSGKATVEAK